MTHIHRRRASALSLSLMLAIAGAASAEAQSQNRSRAPAQSHAATPVGERAEALRDDALANDQIAWDITEGLTTEVGPRMAGTEAEARARQWGVARLAALGFANPRIETYDMPVWVRGVERAEIVAPYPQPLTLTALGNSGATPAQGITAEVVGFDSFEAFQAATGTDVRGKIVFINHAMERTQDGSSYGQFGAARRQGPTIASRRGAAGIVVRSIGTDTTSRTPHTGVQTFGEGAEPIPAAALSLPDAEQLRRILARAKTPVRMHLTLTPRNTGVHQSGNVIAEVPGREPGAGIVLVACHIDSWDLGTGAVDDAAGCGIVTAAAKRIMDAGGARRTIRVLWAGAEEIGAFGGNAYARDHANDRHVLAMESDFGADRVWRVQSNLADEALRARLATALSPLGVGNGGLGEVDGGVDVGPIIAAQSPGVVDLNQDGTYYFDLHHTANDTLDKVDPAALRQNVAAWVATLAVLADAPGALDPAPATRAQ